MTTMTQPLDNLLDHMSVVDIMTLFGSRPVQFSRPPEDTPTVDLQIGRIYRDHKRCEYRVIECHSFRFTAENVVTGVLTTYEPNGRRWHNGATWGDLVSEV